MLPLVQGVVSQGGKPRSPSSFLLTGQYPSAVGNSTIPCLTNILGERRFWARRVLFGCVKVYCAGVNAWTVSHAVKLRLLACVLLADDTLSLYVTRQYLARQICYGAGLSGRFLPSFGLSVLD